jgi:malonate decarboxylase epsilon subunit
MSTLFTFPGQGAQRPGMLHRLPDHPEAGRTIAEAADALGEDPLRLDTAAAFASSFAVQTCLLLAGVATARVLAAYGARPDMVAGLSIGAYPAAVVAGILDYADAVRLVARRGRLMDRLYPTGHGMAAIVGLDQGQLEPLIARVHTRATPVYLANFNAPRQFVIAGTDEALEEVIGLAVACGATRAERLAVTVPSHCELFDDAAIAMRDAFRRITLRRPDVTYLSTGMARVLSDPKRIADDLADNVAKPVYWHDTVRLAWERGARLVVEMPSGTVLTNLTAPVFAGGQAISCENTSPDTVLVLMSRERQA